MRNHRQRVCSFAFMHLVHRWALSYNIISIAKWEARIMCVCVCVLLTIDAQSPHVDLSRARVTEPHPAAPRAHIHTIMENIINMLATEARASAFVGVRACNFEECAHITYIARVFEIN